MIYYLNFSDAEDNEETKNFKTLRGVIEFWKNLKLDDDYDYYKLGSITVIEGNDITEKFKDELKGKDFLYYD